MQSPSRDNLNHAYGNLVEALKILFRERLKTVVLFGSRARGQVSSQSDHDLFVVIDGLPSDPILRARKVRQAILEAPLHASLVAKTPREIEANLTPLILDVCVDGICLYGQEYFETYRRKALKALRESGLERKQVGREWMWRFRRVPASEWELTWEGFRELR
jgi:predicted nucleotidyltransferase